MFQAYRRDNWQTEPPKRRMIFISKVDVAKVIGMAGHLPGIIDADGVIPKGPSFGPQGETEGPVRKDSQIADRAKKESSKKLGGSTFWIKLIQIGMVGGFPYLAPPSSSMKMSLKRTTALQLP